MAQRYCTALRRGSPRLVGTWGSSRPATPYLKRLAGIMPLLLLSGWLSPALAGQVKLAWNAPTTYTNGAPVTALAGYHLYVQDSAGGTRRVDIGNQTTYTLTGLTEGTTYTLAITALDTSPTGNESSKSNTITVSVPRAQPDTATAPVGTSVTIAVLANDTDPDGNPLTITAVTQGMHGTVTRQSTSVTYRPVATFVGTDSFSYTITDGRRP
jgi:Bacterial Ig domain/Fibronectin type III domain